MAKANVKAVKGWAVRFPDKTIDPRWIYATKKELKRDAPVQIYGDTSTWDRAKEDGYRITRVVVIPLA